MENVVRGDTTPSRRQIALELTCAIMGNPNISVALDPEEAADQALELLGYLEKKLRLHPTFRQPAD